MIGALQERIIDWHQDVSFGTFWSLVAFFIVIVAAVSMAFVLHEPEVHSRFRAGTPNAFSLLIGTVSGWALGVFWVPFNTIDAKVYEQIGATVTAFATGYLLSKFDRVFELLLYEDDDKKKPNRNTLRRAPFFAVGLIVTALLVTGSRLDWLEQASRCNPQLFDKGSTLEPDQKSCDKAKLTLPKYIS